MKYVYNIQSCAKGGARNAGARRAPLSQIGRRRQLKNILILEL